MRRITKLEGGDSAQGVQSTDHNAAAVRRTGETFTCLGDVARSVVLRIKGGLPRISVDPVSREEVEDWIDL